MYGRPQSRDAFTLQGDDQMPEQTRLGNSTTESNKGIIPDVKKALEKRLRTRRQDSYNPCEGTVNPIMIDGMVVYTYTCPISTNTGCFSTIQKYGAALCEPIKVTRYSHTDKTLIAYNKGCRCMQ